MALVSLFMSETFTIRIASPSLPPSLSPSLPPFPSYVYTLFGTSGQLTLGPVALVSLFMSETFTNLGISLAEKDKVGREGGREVGRVCLRRKKREGERGFRARSSNSTIISPFLPLSIPFPPSSLPRRTQS